MDQEDLEKRVAELERQLAEQKRVAELDRQFADAKAAERAAERQRIASELERHLAEQQRIVDRQVAEAQAANRAGKRKFLGIGNAYWAGPLLAGLFVSFMVAVFSTVFFPSSVLWTSGIVCDSGHHLAESRSQYSYQPGRWGTSSYFWCVNDASSLHTIYYEFPIVGLQFLLAALVICPAMAAGGLIWRLLRKSLES